MKRRPLLALAAGLPLAGWLPAMAQTATVGQAAPDFSLEDTSGKPVKLSAFRGKTVVLEWNNPGCPFVRKHYQGCLLYTSPSPRDKRQSRMPSSA